VFAISCFFFFITSRVPHLARDMRLSRLAKHLVTPEFFRVFEFEALQITIISSFRYQAMGLVLYRLRYFFTRYRYVLDKSSRMLFVRSCIYFLSRTYASSLLGNTTRRLRFFEKHGNPGAHIRYNKHLEMPSANE